MFKLSLAFSVTLVAAQIDLTVYCAALASQCMSVFGINATVCEQAMGNVLPGNVNETEINTIGCRMKYLDNPDFKYPNNENCRFAGPSGGGRCGDVLENVCYVATTICNGVTGASFGTTSECTTGLNLIRNVWGSKQGPTSSGENSLECRLYHAINSANQGLSHCGHFNLSTDGGLPCSGRVTTDPAHYCDVLDYNCKVGNAQFSSKAQCLKVASAYPNSTTEDTGANNNNNGNNLGCRAYHAQVAKQDPDSHCQHAGPTGAGICGSPAEAWGSMLARGPCTDSHVATFVRDTADTVVDMMVPRGGLNVTLRYNLTFDTSMNTQACRIYHLSVASLSPVDHCHHGFLSGMKVGMAGGCGSSTVSNLCTFIEGACGFGAAAWQFASPSDCTSKLAYSAAAGNIVQGVTQPTDDKGDSYECRFYHASVAASFLAGGANAASPTAATQRQTHCSHTLKNATTGGCGWTAAPTTTPTPVPTPAKPANSASSISLLFPASVVAFVIFSL